MEKNGQLHALTTLQSDKEPRDPLFCQLAGPLGRCGHGGEEDLTAPTANQNQVGENTAYPLLNKISCLVFSPFFSFKNIIRYLEWLLSMWNNVPING